MKLDVDRDASSSTTPQFSQLAANQIGQLMEVLGIASMKVDVAEGASTKVAIPNEIKTLEFAPKKLSSVAVCAASDLSKVMAAVGIVRLSISSVSDEEKNTLVKTWNDSGFMDSDPNSRLVAPPDLNPDMSPIEINL
jgi:hypothetical protein